MPKPPPCEYVVLLRPLPDPAPVLLPPVELRRGPVRCEADLPDGERPSRPEPSRLRGPDCVLVRDDLAVALLPLWELRAVDRSEFFDSLLRMLRLRRDELELLRRLLDWLAVLFLCLPELPVRLWPDLDPRRARDLEPARLLPSLDELDEEPPASDLLLSPELWLLAFICMAEFSN